MVPLWTGFVTADRVQTMQTGDLEPSPRDVSTYADTKITIKIRFDISLCLFYSLPKGDNILLPQGSTAMVLWIKGSKTVQTLWWWQPYKSQNRLQSPQKYTHVGLHTPARTQLQQQLQNHLHQRLAEGARSHLLPKHLSIPHCCIVHSTISHLSANCKALGDSENKAIHTQGFQNLTATVFLSEGTPLLHTRLNFKLKFYWLRDT